MGQGTWEAAPAFPAEESRFLYRVLDLAEHDRGGLVTALFSFHAQTPTQGKERLLYMVHESKCSGGGKVKPLRNDCCDRDE